MKATDACFHVTEQSYSHSVCCASDDDDDHSDPNDAMMHLYEKQAAEAVLKSEITELDCCSTLSLLYPQV